VKGDVDNWTIPLRGEEGCREVLSSRDVVIAFDAKLSISD